MTVSTMSAVVELTNVTKQYGSYTALANVSLEVPLALSSR
jgi:ABC-type sugar transport system ATPase subunit